MREVCLPLWAPPLLGSMAELLENALSKRESTGSIIGSEVSGPHRLLLCCRAGDAPTCVSVSVCGKTLVTLLTVLMLEGLCAHTGWRDKRQTDSEIGCLVPPRGWEQGLDLSLLFVCPSW